MKVKNTPHQETQDFQENLALKLSQNPFVEWITESPRNLLYIGLLLLALFFLAFRFTTGSWLKSESDYYKAEVEYGKLKRIPTSDADSQAKIATLNELKSIIKKHPELKAKYDLQIAQILIAQSLYPQANEFIRASNNKSFNEPSLAFYDKYSNISLLIDNGQDQEALQKALSLQTSYNELAENNENNQQFGTVLFAYNLLRIAFLQQKLGDAQGEIAAWQQWKQYTHLDTNKSKIIDPQVFKDIALQLKENGFSLEQYIEARESKLSS